MVTCLSRHCEGRAFLFRHCEGRSPAAIQYVGFFGRGAPWKAAASVRTLYAASGVVAFVMLAAGGLVAIVLFVLSVIILAVITWLEGDPFINWLQRCWFGRGPKTKYESAAEDDDAFGNAFKGMVA